MLRDFMKKNFFVILFLMSTAFFIYQHASGISWDFASYVLNARYWFSNGFYFEWMRPPLAPLMLGILGLFGWKSAEYLFITLVSALFAFSVYKLSEKLRFRADLFYLLLLVPIVLIHGFSAGTELLSISLIMLFIVYLQKYWAGILAGLMFLTRYPNFTFTPLIFFGGRIKTILINIGLAMLVVSPWLIYNWVVGGNPLTSILDMYAANKMKTVYLDFNIRHVLFSASYLIPFTIHGFYLRIKAKFNRWDLIMLSVLILTYLNYFALPVKLERYLFFSVLPIAYFSYFSFSRIKWRFFTMLFILLLSLLVVVINFTPFIDPTHFRASATPCMIYSDAWIMYDYLGYPATEVLSTDPLNPIFNKGGRIIYHQSVANLSKVSKSFPRLEETKDYIIIGDEDKCESPHIVIHTYLEGVRNKV